MKTIEIVAYHRSGRGKQQARQLRKAANVPCVVYGSGTCEDIHVPAILFRDMTLSAEAFFVNLNVEGKEQRCMLKDIQFHPVSDQVLHADFLILDEKKQTKMDIPLRCVGNSPGVVQGGKLMQRLQKVCVKGLPKDLPTQIEVDVSELLLGKVIRVGDLSVDKCEILENPISPVVTVQIPKVLRTKSEEEEAEDTGDSTEKPSDTLEADTDGTDKKT